MNTVIHRILETLIYPAQWVTRTLVLSRFGIVQLSVGAAVLLLFVGSCLLLLAAWRQHRYVIYLASAFVTLLAGILFTYATVIYQSFWLYSVIFALIAADILVHVNKKQKATRVFFRVWIPTALIVSVATLGTLWFFVPREESQQLAQLQTTTTATQDALTSLGTSTLSTLKSATNSIDASLTLAPSLSVGTLSAIALQANLDFLIVHNSTAATVTETPQSPHLFTQPSLGTVALEQNESGVPLLIGSVAFPQGETTATVSGGMYLTNSRLAANNIHGGIFSVIGMESSANLTGKTLLLATSADTRTQNLSGSALRFATTSGTSRFYTEIQPTTEKPDLSIITVQEDALYNSHLHLAIILICLITLLFIGLFIWFIRSHLSSLMPLAILGSFGLLLLGAYPVALILENSPLGQTIPEVAIRLDHPAITPHLYFSVTTTGLDIQLDAAGANIASLTASIQLPTTLPRTAITLNQDFCSTVLTPPTITDIVLTFSCATPNPALRAQAATIAHIDGPSTLFSTGTVALLSGSAQARTDTSTTETLPLRATPLIPLP